MSSPTRGLIQHEKEGIGAVGPVLPILAVAIVLVVLLVVIFRLEKAVKCAECWGALTPVTKLPPTERTKAYKFVLDFVAPLADNVEDILICRNCHFVHVCPNDTNDPISSHGLVYGPDVYHGLHEMPHSPGRFNTAIGQAFYGSCPLCESPFMATSVHEDDLIHEKLKQITGEYEVKIWTYCRRCSEVFAWVSPPDRDYFVYKKLP